MHLEFLIEDRSGERLLQTLLPKLLGAQGEPHSWRVHAYKGIGRVPKRLGKAGDPSKRILLDQLPRLLRGYGKTPGIDGVVVMVDSDPRDCRTFLAELRGIIVDCHPAPNTCSGLPLRKWKRGISAIERHCSRLIHEPKETFWIDIAKTAFVTLGRYSLMPFTPEALLPSRKRGGLCLDR